MMPSIGLNPGLESDLAMRLWDLYLPRIARLKCACGAHNNERGQIFTPYQDPGTSKIAAVTHGGAPDWLRISQGVTNRDPIEQIECEGD